MKLYPLGAADAARAPCPDAGVVQAADPAGDLADGVIDQARRLPRTEALFRVIGLVRHWSV
ncbi:hypothetical protein AB0940_29570 [Streptomyces sp. NPDC006656]|uniref:hypothetical protein n=1 Tax=Streptomyces sp. NPDC006656 TaxID=3156899 RepID=UPI00345645CC